MKALFAFALLCAAFPALAEEKKTISLEELNSNVVVIGSLGYPIFSVHRVKGKLVLKDPRTKDGSDKVCLQVSEIDGKPAPSGVEVEIEMLLAGDNLPEAERAFEGMVYERIFTDGTPAAAWDHVPAMATTSPSFRSRLVVLKTLP